MSVNTSAGTVVSISAALPGTYDAAGYALLSFTAVGEVTDVPKFGRVYEIITHKPIATRNTQKFKGGFDEGELAMSLGLDTDDAGQILAKAALLSDDDYSIKVALPSGDVYYFGAKTKEFSVAPGNVGSITSASWVVSLSANEAGVGIVEVLAV